jgi:GDPmannose 4,6-dehydratase
MPVAVITGIAGQDASYLCRLLLSKGYQVFGTVRAGGGTEYWRLRELGIADHPELHIVECDVTDQAQVTQLIETARPAEVYNLVAQSTIGASLAEPAVAAQVTGIGVLNLLEAIRLVDPSVKFFQASSAEMFGRASGAPLTEDSAFNPRTPYAVAKLFAHWLTITYRDNYGIFGCCGILFNHESPLRGRVFVTRKISEAFARIRLGQQEVLELGNIDALRDWGFAAEYVEAMWLMLQAESADNYVLATNRVTSVREFVTQCALAAGYDLQWRGAAAEETATDRQTGRTLVRISPQYYRATEIESRMGNPAKAASKLGWIPRTTIRELCKMMVEADLRRNAPADHPDSLPSAV